MKHIKLRYLGLTTSLLLSVTACQQSTSSWHKSIHSFAMVLQNNHYTQISQAPVDMVIVDPQDSGLTASDLQNLHAAGKHVISYLSIGEAETYRPYWKASWKKNPPSFLDKENPQWKGNYKVKYWDHAWQDIMFDRIGELATMGYDGVYLDIVDAYEYYENKGRITASTEMVNFVVSLAQKAKSINPNFRVIPQNALGLVESGIYMNYIDGIGKEDTWTIDNKPTASDALAWDLGLMNKAKNAGKLVLAIDYPTDRHKQCQFIENAKSQGFMPYVGNRSLNKIVPTHCD